MVNILSKINRKFGKSPFTTSIMYQLNDNDENVKKIIEIVEYIEIDLNKKFDIKLNLENIIFLLIYAYHSNKVIFDLPHMLDRIKQDNTNAPCTHLFYNETISQLVSIALISEEFDILNDLYKSLDIKDSTFKNRFLNELLECDYKNPDIFINFDKLSLAKFNENIIKNLFKKTIKLSVLCYLNNIEENNIDNICNIYYKLFYI